MNKKDINGNFIKWFKANFKDRDKIDVKSHYDRSLTLEENQTKFKEKFKGLYVKDKSEKRDEAMHTKEMKHKEIRDTAIEMKKDFRKGKANKVNLKSFEVPKMFVEMVCKGVNNGCVIVGEGGLGKSYLTLNTVKEHLKQDDWVYVNTFITPLSLYKLLYKNGAKSRNENKVIVFDDVRGIFENDKAVSILKSALWSIDDKRVVSMKTTSSKADDVPDDFIFQGKIIILGNKINVDDKNINALVSRTNFYEMNFTYQEKIDIIERIAEKGYKDTTREQRKRAVKLIKKHTNETTENLNFRTLIKTFDYIRYDESKAEKLLKSITKFDDDLRAVKKCIEKYPDDTNSQVSLFKEVVGKSRATYFRKKKEYRERIEEDDTNDTD